MEALSLILLNGSSLSSSVSTSQVNEKNITAASRFCNKLRSETGKQQIKKVRSKRNISPHPLYFVKKDHKQKGNTAKNGSLLSKSRSGGTKFNNFECSALVSTSQVNEKGITAASKFHNKLRSEAEQEHSKRKFLF